MTRRWHIWLLVLLAVAAVVVMLWPAPVTREVPPPENEAPAAAEEPVPATASSPDDGADEAASADASILNSQAMNAWYSGDIEGAMDLFEQAIDADADDPEPLTNYGRLLTLMLSYDKALPMLERARDLRPGDAQSWLDLATLYERTQQLDLSWSAQAEARKLVGNEAVTRDEQGRFIVEGSPIW